MSDAATGMISCRLRRRRNMRENHINEALSVERKLLENTIRRNIAETQGTKTFDRYEDCGCLDRWEAEGGRVVGEAQPSH
jgi:hypothetical protein